MQHRYSTTRLFLYEVRKLKVMLNYWSILHNWLNDWSEQFLFPTQETTITEIKQKIMKIPDATGIVIDGFPRDVGQALSFEDQVCCLVVMEYRAVLIIIKEFIFLFLFT